MTAKEQEQNERWEASPHTPRPAMESRPLRECPHCGKFSFRKFRVPYFTTKWLIIPVIDSWVEYKHCTNCGYRTERES